MDDVTALQKKPGNQVEALTPADVEAIGRELDALRQEVLDSRGARDAAYIRRVIAVQRGLELGSRFVLLASRFPPAWLLGTTGLALAKILDNMEIGHNVLHGQWDWMRDPKIHSSTWDWDFASPAEQWKRTHNETHHTYTNILGMDNDLGYGILRVDEDQQWKPRHVVQPLYNFLNACFFEYGIAAYDLDLGQHLREDRGFSAEKKAEIRTTLHKIRKQVTKDYAVHPVLAGLASRSVLPTMAANFVANTVRNLWSHSVIMCGHFPEGVETFEQPELDERETRGQWYLRQMLGSANVSGPRLLHVLTGNLSHQIEHHLFPDLPSNRYGEIAPRVRDLFARYGLRYHAAPLPQQVASAWHRVVRLSLPNDFLAELGTRAAPRQLAQRARTALERRAPRRRALGRALAPKALPAPA